MVQVVGSQVPRISLVPVSVWSHADDASFLASAYGLTPDPWQFAVLQAWLGEKRNGKWSAGRCGLAVPRQNGKNGVLEIVELFKMVALGRKILHTAHEVKTTRKAFLRLKGFFENERQWPELAALVKEIRQTNGQEAIVLTNGGSCEFIARSRGSGRGYTVDDLVCDEAQELTDEQLEALLPTISAAPSANPQQIYTGTPPPPGSPGTVFLRMREGGIAGRDKRLAWQEWSVESIGDIRDRKRHAATNPAYGIRLQTDVIEDELAQLTEDGFARERLGWWATASDSRVIDGRVWDALRLSDKHPEWGDPVGARALCIDMSPDRSMVTIAGCVAHEDGSTFAEVVRRESTAVGTAWVVDYVVERRKQLAAVVVDGKSPAMSMLTELSARGVKVTVVGMGEMAQACGLFYDAVVSTGSLRHSNQPELNTALAGAKKRPIGDAGGFGWDRRDPMVDLTPLVAVTLAFYGSLVGSRKKKRSGQAVFR